MPRPSLHKYGLLVWGMLPVVCHDQPPLCLASHLDHSLGKQRFDRGFFLQFWGGKGVCVMIVLQEYLGGGGNTNN